MNERFNKVVINDVTQHKHNIHLAVHPFPFDSIKMMMNKGDYTNHDGTELNEWQTRLADSLWDNLPGVNDLFFNNGGITIQHNGIFEDNEIIEVAIEIIEPFLQANLKIIQQGLDIPQVFKDWPEGN